MSTKESTKPTESKRPEVKVHVYDKYDLTRDIQSMIDGSKLSRSDKVDALKTLCAEFNLKLTSSFAVQVVQTDSKPKGTRRKTGDNGPKRVKSSEEVRLEGELDKVKSEIVQASKALGSDLPKDDVLITQRDNLLSKVRSFRPPKSETKDGEKPAKKPEAATRTPAAAAAPAAKSS